MKKLNFTFKQRSQIAQAHLAKIRGKQISKEDDKNLLEFYYRIIDWAFDLRQLNYESDNNIPHVLRQAIRLSEPIQASTNPHLPPKGDNNSQRNLRQVDKCKIHVHTTEVKGEPNKTAENKCSFCKNSHRFYKCQSFLTMAPLEKFNSVKRKKLCYNCLRDDHFTSK